MHYKFSLQPTPEPMHNLDEYLAYAKENNVLVSNISRPDGFEYVFIFGLRDRDLTNDPFALDVAKKIETAKGISATLVPVHISARGIHVDLAEGGDDSAVAHFRLFIEWVIYHFSPCKIYNNETSAEVAPEVIIQELRSNYVL